MKRVNLMPEHLKQAEARRCARRIYGVAFAAAVLVLAGWSAVAAVQMREVDREIAAVEKQIEPLLDRQSRDERLLLERTQLIERLNMVRHLRDPIPPASLLALISQLSPEEAVLRDLVIDLPAAAAAETASSGSSADAPPPVRVKLEGLARDDVAVARLVRLLGEGRVFRNIRLTENREITFRDQPGHRFRITMDVPLKQATAARADGGPTP